MRRRRIGGPILVRRQMIVGGTALLAGVAPGWAQERGRLYRLGVLVQAPRDTFGALFDKLRSRGFAEGGNLMVDPRGFGCDASALGATAEASRALRKATRIIPIAVLADDLLRSGAGSSLAHPSGNITGVSIFAPELDGKRLEILMEMVPGVRRIAVLVDPKTTSPDELRTIADAAASRGLDLSVHRAASKEQIVPTIDAVRAEGTQAINVLASALFNAERELIIEYIARARLPAIYQWPEYAQLGALACYGPRLESLYRQVARQLAKLLAGVKPADVPGEQPAEFALAINLKAARALGLAVPPDLFARADQVIE